VSLPDSWESVLSEKSWKMKMRRTKKETRQAGLQRAGKEQFQAGA
jgi:hypothetical protein